MVSTNTNSLDGCRVCQLLFAQNFPKIVNSEKYIVSSSSLHIYNERVYSIS